MRLTKRQLKRIIREEYSRLKRRGLIRESIPDSGEGSIADVIEQCANECQANPEADVETVCERWLSSYGISIDHYDMVIDAVYQRL